MQHDFLTEDEPMSDDPNADTIKDDQKIDADENMSEDSDGID